MGQTLSEPVTAKETTSCADRNMKVGSSSMQGWRINMEDAHTHILSLPTDKEASFFAVYDGHGGAKVAEYAGRHLHKKIVESQDYIAGRYEHAIRNGFLGIDEDMLQDDDIKDEMAGTTAVVVLLKNNRLFCGNVGDSRAVISVNGIAEPLSYDHKPANESEARRIIAAGGWVEFNRVNGNLALSRALGDFVFKKNDSLPAEEQIVTALPDIISREMSQDVEFMVLACDGIWDVMSNQEVVDYCRDRLALGMEPEMVCEELLTRCLAPDSQMGGLGCDNMTVVLVCLLQDLTWPQFNEKCNRQRPPSPFPVDDDDDEMLSEQLQQSGRTIIAQQQTAAMNVQYATPPHTPSATADTSVGESTAAVTTTSKAVTLDDDDNAPPPQIFKAEVQASPTVTDEMDNRIRKDKEHNDEASTTMASSTS